MQVSNSAFARSITTLVHSTNYKQRLSRVQKPISVSFLLVATCARLTFFFPSDTADVALRLGPELGINT